MGNIANVSCKFALQLALLLDVFCYYYRKHFLSRRKLLKGEEVIGVENSKEGKSVRKFGNHFSHKETGG